MKTKLFNVILAVLCLAGFTSARAQEGKFEKAEATVHWNFTTTGAEKDEAPTVAPAGAIGMTPFSFSSHFVCEGPEKTGSEPTETYLKFYIGDTKDGHLEWRVVPKKGVTFTPTRVTAKVRRFGTDGGLIDVTVRNDEGVSETLETGIKPQRNNKTAADDKHKDNPKLSTSFDLAVPATLATGSGFVLDLHLYDTDRRIGVSDINIYGVVDGEVQEVNVYTLSVAANPEEGGKITVYPAGTAFDEGTQVTLTAAKNFGYDFVNWTDAAGKVVSEETSFVHTVTSDASLTANFDKVATYELVYGVEGGANPYQVQVTPAPVVVNGKNMYEAGTKVTLTALSNPIMAFANWSDGQSSSEISFDMDSDKEITGVFSAADFIVGWDFWRNGSNGRVADFAADENDAVNLVFRNAAGATSGWLDKSYASGSYEGRPAAVNWRTTGLGDYYWQTRVNASSFTDLHVIGAMAYNYNAYTRQNVEASLDGETWENIGTVEIEGAKNWKDYDFALPAKYNNQPAVHIRWIADKESPVDGTESENDGIALGATYITATAKLLDDGTAPVLLSFVPADGSSSASINGRVVLTFDEKVKMADDAKALLKAAGSVTELTPEVTGKTVIFVYKNLAYGTDYTFELPANSVMDLTDNKLAESVTINFATRTRPAVAKAGFDFVVPDDGSFKDAIAKANARSDKNVRFRIFVKKGNHDLPWSETDNITNSAGVSLPSPITYLNVSNVSIIGEDRESTVIKNLMKDPTPEGVAYPIEGLHNVTTLFISKKVENTYIQDITLKNGMNDNTGRGEALEDNGNKTICKNVALWGYQDTYCSNNDGGRFYFEGGVLRGRTDYLCGKGDVFYKDVVLQMVGEGGYLAVPSTSGRYGYVFKDCEIVAESPETNGTFTLGRPWGEGSPQAIFIDTKMTAQPSAIGWAEMSGGWPRRFAEYNSMTATGSVIDLSHRKTTFANTHKNNPVLTKEEAEGFAYEKVMGRSDDWDPAAIAELAPAPTNVGIDGGVLVWDNSDYASCWAVCADGNVIAFTTEPRYNVDNNSDIIYSVRAANEMGGLSEAVVAGTTGINDVVAGSEVVSTVYYNIQGVRVASSAKGVLVKVDTLRNGKTVTSKVVRF